MTWCLDPRGGTEKHRMTHVVQDGGKSGYTENVTGLSTGLVKVLFGVQIDRGGQFNHGTTDLGLGTKDINLIHILIGQLISLLGRRNKEGS